MMIKNVDSVHDEGDLGIFLDEWFEIYGELFSDIKPTINEKKEFLKNNQPAYPSDPRRY
jgi:hypothetical protein